MSWKSLRIYWGSLDIKFFVWEWHYKGCSGYTWTTDSVLGLHSVYFADSGYRYRSILTHGFWPQSRMTNVEFDAMFLSNGGVHKEFIADKHYVGPTCNHPALSFCVAIDCHEGYTVLIHVGNGEHSKPIWLVKTLPLSILVPISPKFCQIELEYCCPSTKDPDVLRTYSGRDNKKGF